MIFQKTIAVDFDGTITLNGDLAEGAIPPPRKNVARVMRKWIEDGFIVIINTLRYEDQWRIDALRYLAKYEIPFSYFNENAPERTAFFGYSRKIAADIMIDDRSLAGIPEDFEIIDQMVRRKIGEPYNNLLSTLAAPLEKDSGAFDSMRHPFDLGWSNKFFDEIKNDARTHYVYKLLSSGITNERAVLEMLLLELKQQDETITKQALHIRNLPKT